MMDLKTFFRYALASWLGASVALFLYNVITTALLRGLPGVDAAALLNAFLFGTLLTSNTIFFGLFYGIICAQIRPNLEFALLWGLTNGAFSLLSSVFPPAGMLVMLLFFGMWFFPQYINLRMIFSMAQILTVGFIVAGAAGLMGLTLVPVLLVLGMGLAMALGAHQGTKLT